MEPHDETNSFVLLSLAPGVKVVRQVRAIKVTLRLSPFPLWWPIGDRLMGGKFSAKSCPKKAPTGDEYTKHPYFQVLSGSHLVSLPLNMHRTISQTKRRQSAASNSQPKPYTDHKQTRSRRGCLTCRIRRKKCDEPTDQSACVSCTRLNIECLGYAPKRPLWLIATGQQCLEAIRRFLAERAKRDPNMLRLAEFYEAYNWVPTLKPSTPEVPSPGPYESNGRK
ncbi:hypothetical protein BS47DRAFT_860261 [Hydnum rufescens UP504]|uniref:Zn(2)-C6 fungal-type domain-containing protein n=1 Tax=Hydnum rufescens UP504 TaxID=1448309 RepID=A0A9P6AZB7_9AGAM|nr:hypothetical protein BS47DRAFT_860261 [Hydnum rufescens UP504]